MNLVRRITLLAAAGVAVIAAGVYCAATAQADTGDGVATGGASGVPVAYLVMLALAGIPAGIAVARMASRRKAR